MNKAEVSSFATNVRFVTTDLDSGHPSFLCRKAYAGRGAIKKYIKNHRTFLHSHRASCHRFQANQFRLLLHSAAYMLLKVAARVGRRGTAIRFHLPTSFPLREVYRLIDHRRRPAPT